MSIEITENRKDGRIKRQKSIGVVGARIQAKGEGEREKGKGVRVKARIA